MLHCQTFPSSRRCLVLDSKSVSADATSAALGDTWRYRNVSAVCRSTKLVKIVKPCGKDGGILVHMSVSTLWPKWVKFVVDGALGSRSAGRVITPFDGAVCFRNGTGLLRPSRQPVHSPGPNSSDKSASGQPSMLMSLPRIRREDAWVSAA